MTGWHRQLNGHEFEQAPGDDEGQGSWVCCSPWGRKELDMTEQLFTSVPLGKPQELHYFIPIIRSLHKVTLISSDSTDVALWASRGFGQRQTLAVSAMSVSCPH